jgi:hypothetical protein
MIMIANIQSIAEVLLAAVVVSLPFLLIGVIVLWVIRLITTLRQRLDGIEDKLDLVLLHLESAKKRSEAKMTKAE